MELTFIVSKGPNREYLNTHPMAPLTFQVFGLLKALVENAVRPVYPGDTNFPIIIDILHYCC